ncbi:O-methyltransferase [Pontiella sulfatireligans]|uniref:O-methyltransferase n=1 Tax=Pontiella sulfatireligans TaxID=2750658 RepID=A0A6C2UKZ4_9BACT|nr:class I SAM-dependent methyltransferase [Pontiella sulfatireligans]VGO20912.1 Putative O-methyltransferase [Pontiella sulfatireligans]
MKKFLLLFLASSVVAAQAQRRQPRGPAIDKSALQAKTIPYTEVEKRIMKVLDDLDANHRRGNMNVPVEDGRLLRLLAESMNARHIVEIGTSNGYSGLWFLMALQKTGGHLTTYEIDRARADLAIANFKRAGVEKDVTLVFGDAHANVLKLSDQPIDVLFLDADKEGYIDYLDKLMPKIRPGGLIIAHNMNTRQAHPPFVEAIAKNPKLETLFLHMDNVGVAVTMKKR